MGGNFSDETGGTHEVEKVEVVDFAEREVAGSEGSVDCVGEEESGKRSGGEVNMSCQSGKGAIWAWVVVQHRRFLRGPERGHGVVQAQATVGSH